MRSDGNPGGPRQRWVSTRVRPRPLPRPARPSGFPVLSIPVWLNGFNIPVLEENGEEQLEAEPATSEDVV